MGCIHLITGGSRSGKSEYARKLGEEHPGPRFFVAPCPIIDEETRLRVARHQEERAAGNWKTIEEPLLLTGAIQDCQGSRVVLVDCLTLWVNNLLYEAEKNRETLDEDQMDNHCREVLQVCKERPGQFIFVTNEVGMGIVPEQEVSRKYRDLVGRCNQTMASGADSVILVVSGLPLALR